MVEGKIAAREELQSVIDRFIEIENDHLNLDEFRRPLESIALALDNIERLGLGYIASELIIGLATDFLSFIKGQYWWYRESNTETDIDDLDDRLGELLHSMMRY